MDLKTLPASATLIALFSSCYGCVGSPVWYRNQPSRKDVQVNGQEYWVVPLDNRVGAGPIGMRVISSRLELKKDLVSAIEQVTNCHVTDSQFQGGDSVILEASVDCKK